jgi:hypothetical protein
MNGYTVTNALSGTGLLANGTVQTILSPAGAETIGTNTLALASSSLRGTYLADVALNGDCDLVTVQGNIDLSSLVLQVVNPALLKTTEKYTIMTCSGTRTGRFSTNNLPDSRWHVVYSSSGEIRLSYSEGTLLRLN